MAMVKLVKEEEGPLLLFLYVRVCVKSANGRPWWGEGTSIASYSIHDSFEGLRAPAACKEGAAIHSAPTCIHIHTLMMTAAASSRLEVVLDNSSPSAIPLHSQENAT